jgi:predicted nucleic acid-binding protein
MSALVDSDIIADYLVDQAEAVELLNRIRRTGLAVSAITYMEILEGVAGSRNPQQAGLAMRRFMRGTRVIVVSRPIAARAAAIRIDLRSRKRPVAGRVLDLIIAATAIEHGLILVTRNLRDYQDITGLRLYR